MANAPPVNGDGSKGGETRHQSELNFDERCVIDTCLSSVLFTPWCSTHVTSSFSQETVADPAVAEIEQLGFASLPPEIKARILENLEYRDIFQLRTVSKDLKTLLSSHDFIHTLLLREQPTLTACHFFIVESVLNWAGFDTRSNKWRKLPPLTFLPKGCDPDPELFKQFLFCTNAGLVCMNFSKLQHEERLVIFNPLSQTSRELPPLQHRRNPVVQHLLVSPNSSYQILVAGSSASSEEHLSTISELYDSRTGLWTRMGDLPGPPFAVNDYQAGVYLNGKIYCIGFITVRDQIVRGLLAFNIESRTWSTKWAVNCFPSSPILQLIENSGELYLFSERENGRVTEHWVDRIQWIDSESFELVNVVKRTRSGGRSLEVYPESALAPFSDGRVCLYNTVDHTGEVVHVGDRERSEALPALPDRGFRGELAFFSLNPISFSVEPKFNSLV